METSKPQVAPRGNVGARPYDFCVKSQKSLRPMPPLAYRSLKLKLVGLKENLLMRADMMWDFLPAERSENRVTDADRFLSLN